jgi:hypothetical protein
MIANRLGSGDGAIVERMRSLVLLLALGLAALAHAQQQQQAQALSTDAGVAAAQAWIGRALLLRGAYTGSELEFNAAGRVKGSPKTTDWTLAGMDLATVSRRASGELDLEGVRVIIGYNQAGHVFERHPQKDQKLRVVIPGATDPATVEAEMTAVFSQGIDPAFERSLPPYWSHYFLPQLPWPDDELKGVTVLGVSGSVPRALTMPMPEKKPEPEMTPEARTARVKGTVQATMVVDAAGMPLHFVIRNPLGWGLDQEVMDALAKYRFKPGVMAGVAVPVQVIVNQAFD